MDEKKELFVAKLPPETTLIDLVNGYTHPVSLEEPTSIEIGKMEKEEARRGKTFLPYENFVELLKKTDGKIYRISNNRNDKYRLAVEQYLKEKPDSLFINSHIMDLLACCNAINSAWIYLPTTIFKARQDAEKFELIKKSFLSVYLALSGRAEEEEPDRRGKNPGLKELLEDDRFEVSSKQKLSLLAVLVKIKRDFKEIELDALNGVELAVIDQKLQKINLAALQEVRQYVEDKLGGRTIGDLLRDDRINSTVRTRSQPAMNEHIQHRLQEILRMADAKAATTPLDDYDVQTVFLTLDDAKTVTGRGALVDGKHLNEEKDKTVEDKKAKNEKVRVEVRYFSGESYHRTKTEDFLERIAFLARVAKSISPKKHAEIERIEKEYVAIARAQLNLNINEASKQPENFDVVIKKAEDLFLNYQEKLAEEVYGKKGSLGKKIKKFKDAAKKEVIKQGRPIIVHISPDGSISAHFPKGKKTYPGDYRTDRTPGVNPNSVLDVIAYRSKDKKSVEVKSVGSRAASYSVFKMDNVLKRRHTLNVKNVKQDIIDRLILENRPLVAGQTIEISSLSLLSPLKKWVEVGGKAVRPGYESETRQLTDHNKAIMALHDETIEVNGVKVKLSINHMNFSVKDPESFEGSGKLLDAELIEGINKKGFEKYFNAQKNSLKIKQEINAATDFDSLIRGAKAEKNLQKMYFYQVCQQYYCTDKKSEHNYTLTHDRTFRFVAQMVRSEQLRGVLVSWNCKTTKDRSGWLSDYLKTLIDQEVYVSDDFDFNARLHENHEFGASLEATSKNSPGARGNRVNDPTKEDTSKVDSRTSLLAKIETPFLGTLKKFLKTTPGDKKAQKEIQEYLAEQEDENFARVVTLLMGISHRALSAAMAKVLDYKGLPIPSTVDVETAVRKINDLFSGKRLSVKEFSEKYEDFLDVVKGIPGFDDLYQLQMIQKKGIPDVHKLVINESREQLEKYLDCLDMAVIFTKNLNSKKSKEFAKYKSQLQDAMTPGLKFGEASPEEKAKFVYVYDKTKKDFIKKDMAELEKTYGSEEDRDAELEKQHAIFEYENQLRYVPPEGTTFEDKESNDVLWKVIERAMIKFSVTDPSELEFEGKLKEKAEAEIARRKVLGTSKKADELETPHIEMRRIDEAVAETSRTAPVH